MTVRYMGGIEIIWSDRQDAEAFLLTQGVDKKGFDFFRKVSNGLELHIKGDKLVKSYEVFDLGKEPGESGVSLPNTSWEDHKIFFLEKSLKGSHRIGGNKPEALILPVHDKLSSFRYLGTIDCSDKYFKWLGIPQFHIVHPTDLWDGVFLDYSNPNAPRLVEPINIPEWYKPHLPESPIKYLETKFTTTEKWDSDKYKKNYLQLCGVPLWIQYPAIPRNPLTGKVMKFVCTINSDDEIKIVEPQSEVDPPWNDYLIFGDVGHLYVFFDPDTKIAHLEIQSG
jgi:hypothetical protein